MVTSSSGTVVAEHVRAVAAGLKAAGFIAIQLALTPLTSAGETIAAAVGELLEGDPRPVQVIIDNDREAGRGYYRELCLWKINIRAGASEAEVGDGEFHRPGPRG